MPRLLGVDIPNDKQIQFSLTYLYGLGLYSAREVCEKLGIEPTRAASELGEDELGRIAALLERDYVCEGPLRRQITQNISRLREVQMLSRTASSPGAARQRSTNQNECANSQGPQEDGRRKERRQRLAIIFIARFDGRLHTCCSPFT